MLTNRINPYGEFIATNARGSWLGNRGQLHGTGKEILRPYKHQAWIICQLQFKNRHREIMAPNLWTELFFYDEVTALAAGHRPCFECRRADAKKFKQAWIEGNPAYHFDLNTPIGKIDEVIHAERIAADGTKVIFEAAINELPNGTFVTYQNNPYLIMDARIHLWTPEGYQKGLDMEQWENLKVLTPKSIVNAMRSGFNAQIGINKAYLLRNY